MNRKRAWVYCRVARPDPDALESQRLHLLDYADRQGLSIVGVTAENGSGLDYSRIGLCDVLVAAEDGLIDVVLVQKLSRLGRDVIKTDGCIHWLRQRDVDVVCADGTVPQTSSDILAHLVSAYE